MGRNFFSFVTLVMLSLFVSCGKNQHQVLTGVKVETSHVSNEIWLSFAADLNLGAMTFPAITLPVYHPRTQAQVGAVELAPALGGKNYIKLAANISALSDIRSTIGKLPNGNAIPLIANNPTVVVALPNGAQLYLTLAENVTAVGVAVPIKQFDQIGQSVGGVNLFPVLTIDKVIATAGLFTSKTAGGNGIAVVADVSQYVNMQDIYVPHGAEIASLAQAQQAQNSIQLDYKSHTPSKSAKEKIDKILLDMNNKKVKLSLNK